MTAQRKNKISNPVMFVQEGDQNEILLFIVYKEKVLQKFEKNEFIKCLSTLIAIYFLFNLPFSRENEKIFGFILESIDFTEPTVYETKRSCAYLKLLESLKLN